MKVMKRAMLLLLAAVLGTAVFAFAGCAKGDEGDTDEIKVVRMWLHKSEAEDEGMVYSALADSFNEEHFKTQDGRDIQVRLEFKSDASTLATAIAAEVLTGGLPDVVAVDAPNVAAYANDGILTDISDYISQEVLDDYVDSVIEQGTIGGGLYALSAMDAPTGLYYNKDLLAQVGYEEADYGTIEDPWTWEDLRAAQEKLKEADLPYQVDLNVGFGGSEGNMYLYSPLVYSAGGSFFGENEKVKGYLDSEASIAGMKELEIMFEPIEGQSGGSSVVEEWAYTGANADSFPQEDVAFQIYGPWEIENIEKNYADFANSYDIMPMPVYESEQGVKGQTVAGCGSWCFGVTPNTRDEYASAKVVEYFTSAFASELLFDSVGTFPTHKSSYENLDEFESGPSASLAEILTEAATPRPKMVNYPKLTDAYKNCIAYIQVQYGTAGYDLEAYVATQANTVDA